MKPFARLSLALLINSPALALAASGPSPTAGAVQYSPTFAGTRIGSGRIPFVSSNEGNFRRRFDGASCAGPRRAEGSTTIGVSECGRRLASFVNDLAPLARIAATKAGSAPSNANIAETGRVPAKAMAGHDIGEQINATIATLPATGGRVVVQPGVYTNVKTTIRLTKPIKLECSTPYSCSITWAAGRNGITCDSGARGSIVEGFTLNSAAVGAENFDGLTFSCQHFTARNLILENWGRDGVAGLSAPMVAGANADFWRLDSVVAVNVRRDGFHLEGSDTNVGVCTMCSVFGYGRYGFYDASITNTYVQPSIDKAAGAPMAGTQGYYIAGASTTLVNPYCEGGAASSAKGYYARITSPQYGACSWTNPGGPSNMIESMVGGFLAKNSLFLGPDPGTASPVVYGWRSGVAGQGQAEFLDFTNGRALWQYVPSQRAFYYWETLRARYAIPAGDQSDQLASTGWASNASNLTQGTIPAARLPAPILQGTLAPTVSSCGKSPAVAPNSSNEGGRFTTGSGDPASCVITFATAWPTAAFCTISPANVAASSAELRPYVAASAASGFAVAMAAGASDAAFNYSCHGK